MALNKLRVPGRGLDGVPRGECLESFARQ